MSEKKRKRGSGPFLCPFPNCDKLFSRSDHLARHKANHSSNKFKCDWEGCGRLFARLDVKKKHESRHVRIDCKKGNIVFELYGDDHSTNKYPSDRHSAIARDPQSFVEIEDKEKRTLNSPASTSEHQRNIALEQTAGKVETMAQNTKIGNASEMAVISNAESRHSSIQSGNISTIEDIIGDCPMNRIIHPSGDTQISPALQTLSRSQSGERDDGAITPIPNPYSSTLDSGENNVPKEKLSITEPPYPPTSLQWLLSDSLHTPPQAGRSYNQPENGAFHTYHDGPLGASTLAMLEEIFALTPEFPNADCQTEVDEEVVFQMVQCIPGLKDHPDFIIPKIKWFLENYWLLYHCQYPILHRPSFSTFDAQSLLLLSMIMMGASFSKKTTVPEQINLVDPDGLADTIANPLRWLIFASEQAKPPCKSWVIQSLIILETYEITSTSRSLHERACIYNGAKVQLLRRSPILGGDPLKAIGSDVSQSNSLWNTWIESESTKRVALMSFYIDTIHAIVYGHPVNLFANQIKLSLPCPDDLWEYNNVDRNKAPMSVAQTPLFCQALRQLLQKERMDVGPFSRHILLAGLINLLLQIEQNVSQWSNFGWESIQENWRDTISSAIEFWKTQVPGGNCCLNSSSVQYCDSISSLNHPLPPFLRPEDTRCSFPVYHAAQIYLRITHYDYIVYAGAPRRMNVPILPEDYEVVVKRIEKWAKSTSGPISVIHSIILLCEVLLSPEDSMERVSYFYEPDKDPFIYRPNIVISAILSLWAYAHHSHGPESFFKSAKSNFRILGDSIPAMEDASTYLSRIRNQFSVLTGKSFANLNKMDSEAYSQTIREYYQVLPKVSHVNYLVGLLTLLKNGYMKCTWHIGREYANLLDNCIQRSLGSEVIFCQDMYGV